MYHTYPKTAELKDGTTVSIRLLMESDTEKLFDMFASLSRETREFLYDDVTDYEIVEEWTTNIDYRSVLPLVVEYRDKILADATLHRRKAGPRRHAGRIRVVVRDDYQGKGIGRILVKELIDFAVNEKLKMVYCTLEEKGQAPLIQALLDAGFEKAADLPFYLVDRSGQYHTAVYLQKLLNH